MNLFENFVSLWKTSIGQYKIYSVILILFGIFIWTLGLNPLIYYFAFFLSVVMFLNFIHIHAFILKDNKIWVAKFFIFSEFSMNNIEKITSTFPKTERYLILLSGEKLVIDPYFPDQCEVFDSILENRSKSSDEQAV